MSSAWLGQRPGGCAESGAPAERNAYITSIHPSIHPCMHACRHADMQTCMHADMQTCMHTDSQPDTHTQRYIAENSIKTLDVSEQGFIVMVNTMNE